MITVESNINQDILCHFGNWLWAPREPEPILKPSTKCPIASGDGVLLFCWENFFMFDELWSEIQDAPGEIFDVIDYKEE